MKSILWAQNCSSTRVSRFVMDGNESNYESREDQNSAYSFLSKESMKIKPTRDYPRLHVYSKGIFIEGYFNEKDESGRRMTYMFFHPEKNIEEAIETLARYSRILGCNVAPSIKNKLEREFINNKKRRIKNVTIAAFVLFATSALLLMLYNQ